MKIKNLEGERHKRLIRLKQGYKKVKDLSLDMRDTYPHDFLIGVIHLHMQKKIDDVVPKTFFRDRLHKLVKEGIYNEPNRWRKVWAFELLGELQYEGETLLYGLFGKIKGKGVESTFDMQKHHYSKEYIEKNIAQAYSFFIINPEHQTIIFEEKTSLKYKHFIRMFKRTYNEFYHTQDEITIDMVKDESKLLEDLDKKKILYIEFDLQPSNPEDEEDFRPIDTLLKKASVKNARIKIENPKGLSLEKEGLARQGVALASASYGKYRAQVEQNGRKTIISSEKDKVLRETVDLAKIFSKESLNSILKRFESYKKKEKDVKDE